MKSQKILFAILFVLINSQKFLNENKPQKPEFKPPKPNEINNQTEFDKMPNEQFPEHFNDEKHFPKNDFQKDKPDFQKDFQEKHELQHEKPDFLKEKSNETEFENFPPMNDDFHRRRPKNFEDKKDFNEQNRQFPPHMDNNQQKPMNNNQKQQEINKI